MKKKKFKFPDFNKMSYKEETLVLRVQRNIKERLEHIAKNRGISISCLARMWLLEKLQSAD